MKSVAEWLDEYGESHRHPANKILHWICVPVIIFSLLGILWLLPFPEFQAGVLKLNWCTLLLFFILLYYFYLSRGLAVGMLVYSGLMCLLLFTLANTIENLFIIYLSLFVIAWIGQFIGHHIEGKQPSFFKDIQFLLIGPLWLLSSVYKKLNIVY